MTCSQLIQQAQSGSKQAEEEIISQNRALVMSIAKKFSGRGLDADDVFQLGCVGMLKAIRNFDLSYGVEFSKYAVPVIMGEIKRYFRDNSYIKVSRSMRETAIKAFSYREKIIVREGREPAVSEIASNIGMAEELVVEAMESQMPPEYLYSKINGTDSYVVDRVMTDEGSAEKLTESLCLKIALSALEKDEKFIVTQRYFRGITQTETAKLMGVSQVHISRKEKKILQKLKGIME